MRCLRKIFLLALMVMAGCPALPAMAVTLLNPNGKEILNGGATFNVQWQGGVGEVTYELKYSTNGGKQWKKIIKGIVGTSYDWTVPLLKTNFKDCRVLVSAYNASRKKISEDRSDESFAIDVVSVTSPAVDETLTPGSIQTITWTTTPALSSVGQVLLKYSTTNGKKWTSIGTASGNPGLYDWKVPWLGGAFLECKVMVELKSEKGKTIAQGVNDNELPMGYTPEAYSDQMTEKHGEDSAFDAVALAIDKGYSLPQIFDASVNDRLAADGVITGPSGETLKPPNPPTNYFVSPSLGQYLKLPTIKTIDARATDLSEFRTLCKQVGGSIAKGFIVLILDLTAKGYTLDQIIDAIYSSDICFTDWKCKSWKHNWVGGGTCSDGRYRWEITLGTFDPDTCDMTGTIYFHNCPGGGKVEYSFTGVSNFDLRTFYLCQEELDEFGNMQTVRTWPKGTPREGVFLTTKQEVYGAKSWGAGDLGEKTPQNQVFKLRETYPPEPNFAP
jgi:hypothetical protein